MKIRQEVFGVKELEMEKSVMELVAGRSLKIAEESDETKVVGPVCLPIHPALDRGKQVVVRKVI